MTTRLLRAAALAALGGAALACGSLLAPAPDVSRYYVLAPRATPAPEASSLALGVGPVEVAGYLQAPEVQVRLNESEVRRSPVERWAEPLDVGVTRVLAQDLSAALGTPDVVLFPWYAEDRPDVQVAVSVRRFEIDPDGSGVLEARYRIVDLAGDRPPALGDATFRRPAEGGGRAASVAALSQTLADLAEAIAGEVRSRMPGR
jgi:uncharacterized protein